MEGGWIRPVSPADGTSTRPTEFRGRNVSHNLSWHGTPEALSTSYSQVLLAVSGNGSTTLYLYKIGPVLYEIFNPPQTDENENKGRTRPDPEGE